jgi:hypothetical protein
MTLPDERYRAVKYAAEFLQRLAGGHYARVPKAVRGEAAAILRHYPGVWDLKRIERAAPEIMQESMEPLHRMVASYGTERTAAEDDHEGSTLD